jgi:hypothetical protein
MGRKKGPHCRSVPKQRSGVLLVTPARVEADEIEPRAHLVRVEGRPSENRVDDARAAGPARVQKERADPMSLIGGRQPNDRERDCRAVGLVVIEWNLQVAALERSDPRITAAPRDPSTARTCFPGYGASADAHKCRAHECYAKLLHPAVPLGLPAALPGHAAPDPPSPGQGSQPSWESLSSCVLVSVDREAMLGARGQAPSDSTSFGQRPLVDGLGGRREQFRPNPLPSPPRL